MIAHESAYEQLTLSIRENWLVVDGSVQTLQQKEEIEALLRRLLGVCGVKSELYVRSAATTRNSLNFIAELDCSRAKSPTDLVFENNTAS